MSGPSRWLGTLPVHWDTKPLGRECWVRARLGWKGLKAEEYVAEGGYPMLATPNIKGAEIDFVSAARISRERYDESPEIMLNPGDVLLTKDGSTIGTLNIVRNLPEPATVNGSIAVLTPSRNLFGPYLYYVLASRYASAVYGYLTDGAGVPHLFQRDISKIAIPMPPWSEQQRIANFLDAETAQIDTLIAEQERFITLLRERRSAAIAARFSELGGGRTELRRVASVQTGVTLSGPGDLSSPEWPYLRVANVQTGYVDLAHVTTLRLATAEAKASMLRKGDVLMTEGGDIDKLGRGALWNGEIEPIIHQNHVFAVRPGPRLLPEYLVYWLDAPPARTHFFTTAKKTTNLASTNKTIVGRLPLVLPSIEVQREFVDFAAEKSQQTDALTAEAEHNIALSKERRAALITAAVTGQIDVSTGKAA